MRKRKKNDYIYIAEWKKSNVRRIDLEFNITKEKDLLDQLMAQENMSGYIKRLIREDIGKSKINI